VVRFALLAALALGASPADGAERKPNVVVILADDVGHADLGCFGQKELHTPRLDRMAKEGMKLTQFYAGGGSGVPSRA
jgi:arylsulfatase